MNYIDKTALTQPPVTVIDSIMGSGKTTWIIDHMNTSKAQEVYRDGSIRRFIYVTPMLEEAEDRIPKACPILSFKNPVPVHGSKFYDFKQLLRDGENISTTHALFRQLDRECYDLIQRMGYVLVIDEALSCLEVYDGLTSADRDLLFRERMVYIEEGSGRLRWNHVDHSDYEGRFSQIMSLCDNGNLVTYGKDANSVILFWEFAVEFLYSFRHVFILTYLYQGSPMSLYMRIEGFKVDLKSVANGKLIDYLDVDEGQIKRKLRQLITVYRGPKNAIGSREGDRGSFPFSAKWFDTELKKHRDGKPNKLTPLRGTVSMFFKRDAGTRSALNGWTTLKKVRKIVEGPGYSRGFIPINAKATNDYKDKTSLAYIANVYYQTPIKQFFVSKGIGVHEDLFALSEMVQWVWRSAIREDKPIMVFIPSERMRDLFLRWLNTDSYDSLVLDLAAEYEDRKAEAINRQRTGVLA